MTVRWRGRHVFDTIVAAHYEGALLGSPQKGNNYYVDGIAGSNSNSGRDPRNPKLTILAALALVTDYNDDYIWVNDHYQETMPISIDKNSVHIIAAGPYNVGQPMVYLTPSGDTPVFNIADDFVEIAGFEFKSGATKGAIEWTATKGYGLIRDCVFGRMQTGQDGINVPSGFDAVEMIIRRCLFGSGLTRDGIRIDHNMTRGIIEDCTFRAVPGIGINVSQMANGIIRRNKFMLPSDTTGKAITLAAAVSGVFVEDNDANFGGSDAMGNVPWVVTGGVGDGVTFDNNKRGGVVVFPA